VLAIIIGFLAFSKAKHVKFTPAIGTGCLVRGQGFDVPLTSGQAGLAAIIAGVARRRAMPVRAVTIAYAAALQESDLADLPYGDRDSVGIFQQRPSQGWGTRQELLNPVFATTRFFGALAAIPGYQHLLVYQAAQDVQRSADGYAYSQYSGQGTVMAAGFTGQRPHDVWCWYGGGVRRAQRLAAAGDQLRAAFGGLRIRHVGDPLMHVQVASVAAGWAVAAWLVTHAYSFGIENVSFQGYSWTAARGQKGWIRVAGPAGAKRGAPGTRGTAAPGASAASPSGTGSPGHRGVRHHASRAGAGSRQPAARRHVAPLAVTFG